LRREGRIEEAIGLYRRALAMEPADASIWFRLGNALKEKGDLGASEAAYRGALNADPRYGPASVNLAALLDETGRPNAAIEMLDAANRLGVALPEVPNNLAVYLTRRGRHADAESALRRLVELRPTDAGGVSALATAIQEQGRIEEAIGLHFEALSLQPDRPDVLNNLTMALVAVGRLDAAEASCCRALAIDPDDTEATSNLGFVYREQGKIDRAIAVWRRLLGRAPDHATTQSHLALALLAKGDFEEGWRRYEWRFRTDTLAAAVRHYPQPVWDGSAPANRTILLDAEQGIGDAIQFLRYAAPLAERGATVIAEAPRKLHRLLKTLPGIAALVDPADPRPTFDLHAPLMSLPHLCGTTLDTVPDAMPYLAAEPGLIETWRARLAALPRPWIGLCWQGNPLHRGDRWRSIPLAQLRPLAARTAGTFVSLQKGPGVEQIAAAGFGNRLVDWQAMLDTGPDALVDTAAMMASLDIVVTVDTALAHLAGALARPTIVMLTEVPDFRWMLARPDSPWYPTARLARQRRRGDWMPVIDDVASMLETLDAGS
jgi:Flp pilus assembly protein TadD